MELFEFLWKAYLMLYGGDKVLAWVGIIVIALAAIHLGTSSEPDTQDSNSLE